MAKNFDRTDDPKEGDLVACNYTSTGGLHVGIWLGSGVYHAYRVPGRGGGDTVITSHVIFSNTFKNIRYYRWRK